MNRVASPTLLAPQRLVAALLLFAFLPTLTFFGHWDDIFGGVQRVAAPPSVMYDLAEKQADATEHTLHCHTNLASCSAQPIPAGLGLLGTHEALFGPAPTGLLVPLADTSQSPSDAAVLPLVPPPRSA